MITDIEDCYRTSYRAHALAVLAFDGMSHFHMTTDQHRAVGEAVGLLGELLAEMSDWLDNESCKRETPATVVANKTVKRKKATVRK